MDFIAPHDNLTSRSGDVGFGVPSASISYAQSQHGPVDRTSYPILTAFAARRNPSRRLQDESSCDIRRWSFDSLVVLLVTITWNSE